MSQEVIIKFIQRYIYGGILLLEKHYASFIFELMLIAYVFLFDELDKQLQAHLIEKEAHWLRLYFNLQENSLVLLIRRDDLQMEEIKI
ncbi:hypothetical protein C2G38_2200692 [Gigaspora rosea]|uniref:Uncharacterized protein n=1 Tax=Gigaspora rosea TaxID=44941 RepID=A0A397URM2_9GLOM|nr:hypothetical protein C2G38_2200692 [Gigaspora rosea]